jgi:hypothetical protein
MSISLILIYFAKGTLWKVFFNSTLQTNITGFSGSSFSALYGFGVHSSFNTSYFVIDNGADKVYILKDDLSFFSHKNISKPFNLVTVGSSIYITGDSNIWKFDKDFNLLVQQNTTSPYRGIYYSSTSDCLFVAPYTLTKISVFDLNLTFNHSISTSIYNPFSIAEYNSQLFVGTTNGTILLIVNETIVNKFNGCNNAIQIIFSILFDQFGYMATSCYNNQLYLYYSNGTFTGKIKSTVSHPTYINFDINGRFILILLNQIQIYL